MGTRRVVILMDFNCPGSRDTLRLPQMIAQAANLSSIFGHANVCVLAWMPNLPKEGSQTTADDDEQTIKQCLMKVGFKSQLRVRMMLDPPDTARNMTSQMDWWIDGRLCFFGEAEDNFWKNKSELARIRRVDQKATLPEAHDMVDLTSLNPDDEINTSDRSHDLTDKMAQRGPNVAEGQLNALFTKSACRQGVDTWLCAQDDTFIVDFHPCVGDRALGTYQWSKDRRLSHGNFRHIIVKVGQHLHGKQADFTVARVEHKLCKDWLKKNITLFEKGPNGLLVTVIPTEVVPPPSDEELKRVPGGLLAYKGLSALSFKACVLRGSGIKLNPEKLGQFAMIGLAMSEELERLKREHETEYEEKLLRVVELTMPASQAPTPLPSPLPLLDGRGDGQEPNPDGEGESPALVEFESLDALKGLANITVEVKSAVKGLTLFKDEGRKVMYGMAKADDLVVPNGTHLGGVGGGNLIDKNVDTMTAVPWVLPKGDQTWVQLNREKGDGADDAGERQPKFTSGSLYAILREIEAKSTTPIRLTSFGEAKPKSENGRHCYEFATPPGAENHRSLDFVATPSRGDKQSKPNGQNVFHGLAHRDHGLGDGVLELCWRLNHDTVGNTLKPFRPSVVTKGCVEFKKGKPVKLSWAKQAAKATFSAQAHIAIFDWDRAGTCWPKLIVIFGDSTSATIHLVA